MYVNHLSSPFESDDPMCKHGHAGGLRGGCPDCRELELMKVEVEDEEVLENEEQNLAAVSG